MTANLSINQYHWSRLANKTSNLMEFPMELTGLIEMLYVSLVIIIERTSLAL